MKCSTCARVTARLEDCRGEARLTKSSSHSLAGGVHSFAHLYRVAHHVSDLGLVDFDFDVTSILPSSAHTAILWSAQAKYRADSGRAKLTSSGPNRPAAAIGGGFFGIWIWPFCSLWEDYKLPFFRGIEVIVRRLLTSGEITNSLWEDY